MNTQELQARREQIAAEFRAIAEGKRAKLAALISSSESAINWDVEWQRDTRVRSFEEARGEIAYFERRLADAEARALAALS